MFGQEISVGARPFVLLGPLLQLNHLTLGYWRLHMADVNLTIQAGGVIGLAGLEGSGNSCSCKLVKVYCPPQAGQIILDGAGADPSTLCPFSAGASQIHVGRPVGRGIGGSNT